MVDDCPGVRRLPRVASLAGGLCTALVGAPAPAARAQAGNGDWAVERLEWRGELPAPGAARLENLHGDLRVRAGLGAEVYVVANVQHHARDPHPPRVDVTFEGSALRVVSSLEGGAEPAHLPAERRRRRVDLTVLLPAATRVDAETDVGLTEIRGLTGELRILSSTGGIAVRSAGRLVARTEHGDILAQFRRGDWSGRSELETSTGAIRAELPWDADAHARIETRGEITTDYSLRVSYAGAELKRGAVGSDDGATLLLRSYSGPIKLIRSRVPAVSQ